MDVSTRPCFAISASSSAAGARNNKTAEDKMEYEANILSDEELAKVVRGKEAKALIDVKIPGPIYSTSIMASR